MQLPAMLSALVLLLFASLAQAQFQFFEQMFGGGGGQQQAQPQNMPSDSAWYQTQYEAGESTNGSCRSIAALEWDMLITYRVLSTLR